jgi:hypothetical protein
MLPNAPLDFVRHCNCRHTVLGRETFLVYSCGSIDMQHRAIVWCGFSAGGRGACCSQAERSQCRCVHTRLLLPPVLIVYDEACSAHSITAVAINQVHQHTCCFCGEVLEHWGLGVVLLFVECPCSRAPTCTAYYVVGLGCRSKVYPAVYWLLSHTVHGST